MFTLGHTQEEIDKANNLVYSMKYKVEEYSKLLELAKADKIETIRNSVDYVFFRSYLKGAYEYCCKTFDENTKKECKHLFNLLQDYLRTIFDNSKIKITNIQLIGYDRYAYSIRFKIDNNKFSLDVPIIGCVHKFNFEHTHDCKLALYHETKVVIEEIGSTYVEEELKDIYDNWLKEETK